MRISNETRAMRRTHVRGHANILQQLFVHSGGFNLGLLMRTLVGVGTPRGLQERLAALLTRIIALWTHVVERWVTTGPHPPITGPDSGLVIVSRRHRRR